MLRTTAAIRAPLRTATSQRLNSSFLKHHARHPKHQLSPFSTTSRRLQQQTPSPQKPNQSSSSQQPNGDPELPKFSLDGLGISPAMKKVIIGVICVFGTMETYTYYIWIKNRWFPDEKEGEEIAQK